MLHAYLKRIEPELTIGLALGIVIALLLTWLGVL
jgi:hypothetical protein